MIDVLSSQAQALLMICVVAAMMDQLHGDEGSAAAFGSICALAVAVGVYRLWALLTD